MNKKEGKKMEENKEIFSLNKYLEMYDKIYGRTLDHIKEIFPKEYEIRLNKLKEDEE